jgi:hypothetical protein
MKKVIALFSLLFLFVYCGCSSCPSRQGAHDNNQKDTIPSQGQDIAVNKSIVTAEVEELILHSENEFTIKAKVTGKTEQHAYPDMAVVNETYFFKPNFELNENDDPVLDSDRNTALYSLLELSRGDSFRAEIFFTKNGWFIQRVID